MSLGLRHIKIYSVKWNIVGNVYYPAFTNVLSVSRFYVFKHLKKIFLDVLYMGRGNRKAPKRGTR